MNLIHLSPILPSLLNELAKEAGIKDDLVKGTKRVANTIKNSPKKVNDYALKTMAKIHTHPVGGKIMTHGPDILRKLLT